MTKIGGSIIDLFSGCGGFSLGAEAAGFKSIAAIDIDPILQSAYRKNFNSSKSIQADITHIENSDWRHLIGNIRVDGVIGGPPCQGFSWIGKRKKDDPRNTLIGHYCRHVKIMKPKFFVLENVEGILDIENVDVLQEALEIVPPFYTILDPFVVSASDFGAPTSRKRVFVVGFDPTEVDALSAELFRTAATSETVTVRDAISDLPSPHGVDGDHFDWIAYPAKAARQMSDYARIMRTTAPTGLGWSEAVAHQKRGLISGLRATKHTKEIAERYSLVPGGKCDPITKSYRLQWDGRCPSLRAGTGAEKGAFQAVRPLHPGNGRVITVREAARLQSFPDWFVFHPTKWHSFRMIGNSVSPLMSKGILSAIFPKALNALAA